MGNRSLIMPDENIAGILVEAEICDGDLQKSGTGKTNWQRYYGLVFRTGPQREQPLIVLVSLIKTFEADRKLSSDRIFQARKRDSDCIHIAEILAVQYPGPLRGHAGGAIPPCDLSTRTIQAFNGQGRRNHHRLSNVDHALSMHNRVKAIDNLAVPLALLAMLGSRPSNASCEMASG